MSVKKTLVVAVLSATSLLATACDGYTTTHTYYPPTRHVVVHHVYHRPVVRHVVVHHVYHH